MSVPGTSRTVRGGSSDVDAQRVRPVSLRHGWTRRRCGMTPVLRPSGRPAVPPRRRLRLVRAARSIPDVRPGRPVRPRTRRNPGWGPTGTVPSGHPAPVPRNGRNPPAVRPPTGRHAGPTTERAERRGCHSPRPIGGIAAVQMGPCAPPRVAGRSVGRVRLSRQVRQHRQEPGRGRPVELRLVRQRAVRRLVVQRRAEQGPAAERRTAERRTGQGRAVQCRPVQRRPVQRPPVQRPTSGRRCAPPRPRRRRGARCPHRRGAVLAGGW